MNELKQTLSSILLQILQKDYSNEIQHVDLQPTRKDFEGDLTYTVFPLVKITRKAPELLGQEIGEKLLVSTPDLVEKFNVIKGFLNISIRKSYFLTKLVERYQSGHFISATAEPQHIMVEYSSPNTNKPLHLGHIRNCLLGWSVSRLYEAIGHTVYRVQIINDRGIHICKSMVAWQKFANGATPASTGIKGDHFVGDYYVLFEKEYKQQVSELIQQGVPEEEAKEQAPIMREAREMLVRWEQNDPATLELWNKMNSWVYEGFDRTYARLGVSFHKNYYESQTFLLGRDIVQHGLEKGIFYKKEDGSVWIDLTADGLDHKLLLRRDGTSVYITQDIGTAIARFEEFPIQKLIYTVANEQDYHFKVLFLILKKLGYSWADHLYHLSYGMVELPHGRMKSREGTVVDADDLLDEMEKTSAELTAQFGKAEGLPEDEKRQLYTTIGHGALKYFILKVDPRKKMIFNPEESIDFNGHTGPFIQYTHARISSLLHRAESVSIPTESTELNEEEYHLLKSLLLYSDTVHKAAAEYNPSELANYLYEVARLYNSMYQKHSILTAESIEKKQLRIFLSDCTRIVLNQGLDLLGIKTPERM
ncbi:arginine--tRNA ligase [Thermaurantimonas aggregans]|uniref:Arginine--tRNA ligase n=1 Tax=Thermaurantimonas aggregans TaxID=2173829 RepID=A0A401XM73_9FLAO|nr:arginine--tRNA ligase [Thermaurantimonas aggregans]MCX8147991.1 arginine--tRNA ligase [Thermaurantimonas aggregans]GCD78120.1 arginine--tRNA ligase [Thermaurantimonas aggregans]